MIPSAGQTHQVPAVLFDGFVWKASGDFKILGAPVGSPLHCCNLTSKRRAKAETLHAAIGDYDDAQGALLLLRHCASFCKLGFSLRTVPPSFHAPALDEFNAQVRATLDKIMGQASPDDSWKLAQLRITDGGLGVRDASLHASAAYLASLSGSWDLCQALDSEFDQSDACGALRLQETIENFNSNVLEAARVITVDAKVSQKKLSGLVDALPPRKNCCGQVRGHQPSDLTLPCAVCQRQVHGSQPVLYQMEGK